jgi:AraC-like DNA-binding protein
MILRMLLLLQSHVGCYGWTPISLHQIRLMVQSKDDLTSFRVSTSAFPERDAPEILREEIGRAIMRVQMDPLHDARLEADITFRANANFGMATGMMSPMRNVRGPSHIDNDDLILVFMRGGNGILEQGGLQFEVSGGQAVLTDNGAPANFTYLTPVHATALRFSRSMLAPHLKNLDRFPRTPHLEDSPALRLLRNYVDAIESRSSLATSELRQIVTKHVYDLAALALGARRDSAELASNRGLRAARFQAVTTDIVRNMRDHSLSPDAVAARNGISPRYMRMLFEREGTSFSEFVLFKRLQLVHHMIRDPQNIRRPISSIAFDCGFGDLSHFNHSFRKRYRQTPSEVRASAHIIGR